MHRLQINGVTSLALVLALTGCQATPRTSREPINLSVAKAAVVEYHRSGAYAADLAEVAAQADAWLVARSARTRPGERLAVVFDIDETVLSNYDQMVSQDFGYVPPVWQEHVARADARAIDPVREVYRTARQRGVDVIFLTGRKEPVDRAPTAANLAREGMGDYTRLILLPADSEGRSAAERKAAVRRELEQEGFRIIASIGDQESDLSGGHAERTFKLPNPFYRVP